MQICKTIGCRQPVHPDEDFCWPCISKQYENAKQQTKTTMSTKYPKYYKSVEGMTEVDVYAIHHLFDIQDPSGAIQHASKKLLLSGVRTGGKSMYQDIQEARDTLTRWLELHKAS